MKNYAQIVDGVAVDVSTNPAEEFHPEIAALFVEVPSQVEPQWRLIDGTWQAPPLADAAVDSVALPPKVSPVEFKLLFTAQERLAIKEARANDPVIDDFFEIVEDPRLTHVNLGLQSTQDALAYLEAKGLITTARRQEALAGQVQ